MKLLGICFPGVSNKNNGNWRIKIFHLLCYAPTFVTAAFLCTPRSSSLGVYSFLYLKPFYTPVNLKHLVFEAEN